MNHLDFLDYLPFRFDNVTGKWSVHSNNETNATTQTDFLEERIIIDVYLASFLIFIGFVGNALSIVVLCRELDKTNTTNWLLQTLAVVDTLYLVACIFRQPLKTIHEARYWVSLDRIFPYLLVYVWPLCAIVQTCTVWTVVIVTIDRYIAICLPFSAHLRTLRRAQASIAGVVIAAIVYNIPMFWERQLTTTFVDDDDYGTTEKKMISDKSTITYTTLYTVGYKTICYFLFRSIGPLLLLIVLNGLLIHALCRNEHRRRDLNHRKGAQHRENITLMLVVVVTVFIACQLPDVALRVIGALHHVTPGSGRRFILTNCVTSLMLTVNSSVNFLIYSLVGKKFRRIFIQIFFSNDLCRGVAVCRCHQEKSKNTVVTSDTYEQHPLDSFPAEMMTQSPLAEEILQKKIPILNDSQIVIGNEANV